MRTWTVLLAEDNPLDIRMAKDAFTTWSLPYALHVVEDGDAALDFVRRQGPFRDAPRPDLVVLDIRMPRRNGFEVLHAIRRDPGLRDMLVAMLTSSDSPQDVDAAADNTADAYCIKAAGPAGMRLVARQLERLVRERQDADPVS